MKKTTTTVITAGTVAMVLTLVGCDASDEFKTNCKNAGGEVKRENDVRSILGMAPVGYTAGKGPSTSGSSKTGKTNSTGGGRTSTNTGKSLDKRNKAATPAPNTSPTGSSKLGLGSSSSKKGKKTSDNDWVCVKNGEVLFED
jgi:hypothetical protein